MVRAVRLLNDGGTVPAGTRLFPMMEMDCSPVRVPSSVGTEAGTPGVVNCL